MSNKIPESWSKMIGNGGLILGLLYLFNFITEWRDGNRIDCQYFLERQEVEIASYKSEVDKKNAEIVELKSKLLDKEKDIEVYAGLLHDVPAPMWVKSLDGKMKYMSDSYEKTFLIPNGTNKYQYVGKTDVEFWGSMGYPEIGIKYLRHDSIVIASGEKKEFIEPYVLNGKKGRLVSTKYPIWDDRPVWNGRKVVSVGGFASFFPDD